MAAATEAITELSYPRVISLRWIISAREDLVWFIGSVAASYVLLILYVSGVLPLVIMAAGWAILIDAPHVFGTFSRTYFDRSEWKTRKRLFLGSLLFFLVGPVMVLARPGFCFFFWAGLLAPMPDKPIALVAILTIYHNLQYHRLIWFHNQKYRRVEPAAGNPPVDSRKYGPASLISRRVVYYVGFGILFGLIYQGPRQY